MDWHVVLPLFWMLLAKVSALSHLYPYGTANGDSENPLLDDGGSPSIPIVTTFAFFESSYQSLFVNNNGVISFEVAVPQYTSQPFPLSDGRAFISPFWADVDNRLKGQVLYRETTSSEILEQATGDVRSYFADFQDFSATWVFIATWNRVTYYGGSAVTQENTFQAVLITNGTASFAMFNYGDVTWTTGTASGGANGVGGTPAQAGFNSGGSTHYFNIPGSRTPDIINVEMTSNVNYPGRWIFRTDAFGVAGGCYANGKMLKYGDVYWTDGTCTTRCKCVGGEVANGIECSPRACSDSEHCVLRDGLHQCEAQETRMCTVSGDPHYNTFDRVVHHFQGTCAYTLARTCPGGALEGLATGNATATTRGPTGTTRGAGTAGATNAADDATTEMPSESSSFHVIAESEHRGNDAVSWTKMVRLEVYGFSLTVNKGDRSRVLVNEELTSLPFTLLNGRVRASQSGSSVAISTDFGLTVTYDADHYATVTVPGAFKGRLCGVCGNYNDDQGDEFTTPNGTVTTSVAEFGDSWTLDPACSNPALPPPTCTDALLNTYRGDGFCGLISNPNGPFAACGSVLSAFNFLEGCVFDMCATGGDRVVLCQSLSAFASACQSHRATIRAWRDQVNCPMACGPNTAYELCGTACPATCGDSTAPNFCTRPCTESCQCGAGLLLSGGACVPAGTGCGCMHDGRYHDSGEVWLSVGCTSRCRCEAGGRVVCAQPGCEGGERCQLRNGTLECAAGRVGAECSAYGDPHYRSFDGRAFDFMGGCRYALASACGADAGALEPFVVEVENENRERLCVSWTKEVTVRVYGQEVKLLKTLTHRALVNGLYADLPVSLAAGRLQVFQSASGALLLTEFGLEVAFDGQHVARVRVPQEYAGLTCGLCGDYNGDPSDDFRLPGGRVSAGVTEFAKAWRVPGGELACRDDVAEPCAPATGDPEHAGGSYCGVLLQEDGPFAACHGHVNVTQYFEDCVLDVGVTQGSGEVLCRALESYVEACQAAAVAVTPWRNSTFCPKHCGPNSHYEVCASSCPESCASQGQGSRCGVPCHEGCPCDAGQVLSGGRCVPTSACGCVHGGSYHALGDAFWEDAGCSRRCSCGAGGAVACAAAACGPSTACGVLAGEVACVPEEGPAFCQAAGDPHYYTFDGATFDFMGACRYTLAKTCGGGGDGGRVPFNVEVENDDRGSLVVSYTNLVQVDVYGHSVVISRADYPRIRVDGVLVNMPVTIIPGNLTVQAGGAALLETNFGLRVQYDGNYVATVWLPRDYRGLACGLCGNFNGNATDDFLLPDGSLAASQNHFGQAWTVSGDGGCQATEPPQEPCPDAQRPQYAGGDFCGVLVDPEGPLASCHRAVRPGPHFQSCVTDVCALGGRVSALCDALHAYASACEAAGVAVSGWRNATACPLTCPAHSHYSPRSGSCRPSCAVPRCDDAGPPSEGCVCDDGYLLSGAACVPSGSCGCVDPSDGRYHLPGDSFWAGDSCRRRCSCAAGGELSCRAAECGPYERCGLENGVAGCHPTGSATCSFYTDPHYVTFDGRSYDYHGTCTYAMARACGGGGSGLEGVVPPFEVLGKNDQRGSGVSWPNAVTLGVYGVTVTVSRLQANRIAVNGTLMSLNWALPSKQIWAVAKGGSVEIMTDFGLKLTYNWRNHASVTVPSSLSGLTCGLCGNYNGDPSDDFALPDGTAVTSVNEFAGSWRAEAVAEDEGCLGGGGAPPPPPLPACVAADRERYGGASFCGVVADPAGPLRGCHAAVNPGGFFESCVSDVCLYGGRRDILCQALEVYVVACQAANGSVDAWRNDSFCPLSCPSNGHYELCGDACQRSCSDLAQPAACPGGPCSEGCRCDRGFFWRSGRCVALAECGCFLGGQNYAAGEVFWPDALCQERCVCRRDGTAACEATGGCGVGETCDAQAGARACRPAGKASCRAWSDPHYVTFDGFAFDFQGACTYTLARNCSRDLPSFEVTARNGNLGSAAVSVPRQVTVTVYGQRVDVFAGSGANVQVNGLNRNLPVSHGDGRLSVYRSGGSTVVSTDFGLQVSYNHRYHVTLEVASTFRGKLCGLCGNYNLNATDEFLSPEGRPVAGPVEFGVSWKVDDASECRDGGEAPPACGADRRALYESDGYCGILTSPDGPFAGCHATVDPAGYFDSCVFDLCALGGSADLLAGALETYTEACQAGGAPVEGWRNDTLGQLSCPPHSHYELCGTGCPSSCADLAGPAACSRPCGEGCQCDAGHVWSGAQCVAVAQCGCDYDGRYLQAGEVAWGAGCSERCECSAGGVARCSASSCPAGSSCSVRGGTLGCHQASAARCTVTNDPHYFTFDGAVVHYQGVCAYDVARPCRGGASGEPPAFRVVMENKRRGTSAVSFISAVHLLAGGAHVLLRGREVLVNGVPTALPAVVAGGLVVAQEGDLVVARTPLNVTVFYDRLYTAHVEAGVALAGLLCGMCGNYNGDPRDDLLTPSGEIAMDARQFGRSWRASDVDASCEDTVGDVEPGRCDAEEMRGHCGVLSDPEGPFRSCHWFIDPALYLDSCVYDLCSYEATKVQLCRSLAAYAQACSLAGVPLGDWRNPSGCPASDPCSNVSCGEREWCGSNSGVYGCYCDETPPGQSVDYTLSCEATTMDINLSSCQLFHKGFTVQYLHLNSPSCRGNDTGGRVSFSTIISVSDHCGSQVTTNATHIIYTNAVRGVLDPSTNPAITQQKKITIEFGCAYPIENNASSTPVLPTINNTEITIPTQPGKFILQMRLYKSETFASFYETAVSLNTNDFLYVGITLSGGDPARFKQQIRDCWATPTADPNHPVQFLFVTNSCPATPDASVKIIENGVSHFSKLSMKVFKFVGNYNQVHLHCRVAVCDSQATTCTKRCSLRNGVPDSETDTKIMTLGPIEKIDDKPSNAEGHNSATSKLARQPAALLLPLALAAAALL